VTNSPERDRAQAQAENPTPVPYLERFCLPFLFETQNADGGWGHRTGGRSSVEPTCWTLVALKGAPVSSQRQAAVQRGVGWLCEAQLADGAWPAYAGQQEGSWATSLACLALQAQEGPRENLQKGLDWLCRAWPGEGGFWWRLRERLFATQKTVRQNSFFRGWSWTPGTSSWVEPTSFALIALRKIPDAL
jgi:hypothetical protein